MRVYYPSDKVVGGTLKVNFLRNLDLCNMVAMSVETREGSVTGYFHKQDIIDGDKVRVKVIGETDDGYYILYFNSNRLSYGFSPFVLEVKKEKVELV
jgi:hypothetical protein